MVGGCGDTECVNGGLERARRGIGEGQEGGPRGAPVKRRGGAKREGEVRRVWTGQGEVGEDAQGTEGQTGSEHGVNRLR